MSRPYLRCLNAGPPPLLPMSYSEANAAERARPGAPPTPPDQPGSAPQRLLAVATALGTGAHPYFAAVFPVAEHCAAAACRLRDSSPGAGPLFLP
jgi:hypothetical protein